MKKKQEKQTEKKTAKRLQTGTPPTEFLIKNGMHIGPPIDPGLAALLAMVKAGSVNLTAVPSNLRSAKQLKTLTKKLAEHDINVKVCEPDVKK